MDISELQEEPTPKASRSKPMTPIETHEKSPKSPRSPINNNESHPKSPRSPIDGKFNGMS